MSLSRDLVRLIRARPRDRQDLEQAALFVLDTLACGIGKNRAEALIAAVLALPDDTPVRSLGLFPHDEGGRQARKH